MSEIPDDVFRFAVAALDLSKYPAGTTNTEILAYSVLAERNRCISIAQSIEPHNEAEAHLIETIVRRMRGEG